METQKSSTRDTIEIECFFEHDVRRQTMPPAGLVSKDPLLVPCNSLPVWISQSQSLPAGTSLRTLFSTRHPSLGQVRDDQNHFSALNGLFRWPPSASQRATPSSESFRIPPVLSSRCCYGALQQAQKQMRAIAGSFPCLNPQLGNT